MLKLEDLTRADIKSYVEHEIDSLSTPPPQRYDLDILNVPPISKVKLWGSKELNRVRGGRLRSRCWGLVQLRLPYIKYDDNETPPITSAHFMHKTVLEFLNIPETWTSGPLTVPDDGFDTCAVLAFISTYLIYIYAKQQRMSAWQEQIRRFVSNCSHSGDTATLFMEAILTVSLRRQETPKVRIR
ncbi:uncharacterized protein Z519_06286 [Cladophialophora bantiana CBS 173.52]|uniref:Uncharacterized protein n=1 Tax=Cladophialophora bantiana (strain ATCC 10958 / CBS 173.52 / CDC B-1940 / NIH 8579) TaxID=1442370 RepID=A0A0D2EUY9_CLAB1|nr:uncharacterized protein Z519_06286 [Cladophialophora bantiana CBS 173.52]KIW93681.1 hypothetical protein Z519_06286 [Cladophialophora bantiana CBS 173.52]